MNISNTPRSGLAPKTHDKKILKAVADEVIAICKKHFDKPINKLKVLDMGSGHGDYANELSKYFYKVVGVEPYKEGYSYAVKNYKRKNLHFVNTYIEKFKPKERFDVVLSLTVFEHIENQYSSFKNTFRLLKKSGIIYLTAPNKYWVFEQHYGLPFLSWLPLSIANAYLKLTRGEKSFKDCSYSRGYFGMKKFFDKFRCDYQFVLPNNKSSNYIGCGNNTSLKKTFINLGMHLINLHPIFWSLSKGFIIIVKKQ